jgi:hypothetical protein
MASRRAIIVCESLRRVERSFCSPSTRHLLHLGPQVGAVHGQHLGGLLEGLVELLDLGVDRLLLLLHARLQITDVAPQLLTFVLGGEPEAPGQEERDGDGGEPPHCHWNSTLRS